MKVSRIEIVSAPKEQLISLEYAKHLQRHITNIQPNEWC